MQLLVYALCNVSSVCIIAVMAKYCTLQYLLFITLISIYSLALQQANTL